MINPNHLPTMHKEFSALKKSLSAKQMEKHQAFINLLNRFMYRYRMAKAFETLVATDVEKRTVDGYACGMKLFMAYSAYDEVRAAEKILLKVKKNETHKWKDKELAEKIRANKLMKDLLLETVAVDERGLRIMLKKFYANKNNEIMVFATSVRHSFVHGDFTTARSGLTNKSRIAVINEVTEVVLKVSDDLFAEILSI